MMGKLAILGSMLQHSEGLVIYNLEQDPAHTKLRTDKSIVVKDLNESTKRTKQMFLKDDFKTSWYNSHKNQRFLGILMKGKPLYKLCLTRLQRTSQKIWNKTEQKLVD